MDYHVNLGQNRVYSIVVTTYALVIDLEWKLIYVGSAEDETYDQLLESVLVGPVNVGNYRFVLQAIISFINSVATSYK